MKNIKKYKQILSQLDMSQTISKKIYVDYYYYYYYGQYWNIFGRLKIINIHKYQKKIGFLIN